MNLAELSICHMSVDLSRGDGGVAEYCLDRTDVGAIAQKIGGHRVS